ncbi:MBL fold metallo-hydrolase [Corynebacterium sp.]|uniref:MBL fold metallo-hydrolase n=1 Tax=Corynebacterium sp. TaxID=1720 RepID=UPI0026DC8365|nr:MBL fold metallo-hydrolase [Corynebacterium sp.]MDO5032984.1 MBL fold metallo-hydrolase [Corynebacterium sp.]
MKLTILGCSGSVPTAGNPASGYLVSFPDAPSIVMDMGPGTLAQLQQQQDPCDAHVLFTHLHADHCLDFPSLMVWRRFHPTAPAEGRNFCIGPANTPTHLGRLSADDPEGVDDMGDTFAFSPWEDGQRQLVDDVFVTPFRTIHPVETYALRMEHSRSGAVITYSGDSAYTENLVEAARGADLFLCEAAWGDTSEGKAPNMHMSGTEAGRIAREAGVKKLVLIHLQPWGDASATYAAAAREFDGEIVLGAAGMEFEP